MIIQIPGESATAYERRKKSLQRREGESTHEYANRVLETNRKAIEGIKQKKDKENERIQLFEDYKTFDEQFAELSPEQQQSISKQWEDQAIAEYGPFYERLVGEAEFYNKMRIRGVNISKEELAKNREEALKNAKGTQEIYDKSLERIDVQEARAKEDFDRLTSYARDDLANTIAKEDVSVARALEDAAGAFGVRGVAGSGVQKASNFRVHETEDQRLSDIRTQFQRGFNERVLNLKRGMEDFAYNRDNLEFQKQRAAEATDNLMGRYDIQDKRIKLGQQTAGRQYRNTKFDLEQKKQAGIASGTIANKGQYAQRNWERQMKKQYASGVGNDKGVDNRIK